MLVLLASLALAQDAPTLDLELDEFGESAVDAPVVINPATIAESAAADQALLDSFYTEAPEATSSVAGFDTSWAWVGGFALLGAAFIGRKKLTARLTKKTKDAAPLDVIARHSVGHQAGLVLLECQTGDGGSRRLLVGVSAHGSPTLVADLGGDIPGFTDIAVAETLAEATPVLATTVPEIPVPVAAAVALSTQSRGTTQSAPRSEPRVVSRPTPKKTASTGPTPKRALVGRFTDADLAPLEDAPIPEFDRWEKTAPPHAGLQAHLSLVDEVLAGRQVWEARVG